MVDLKEKYIDEYSSLEKKKEKFFPPPKAGYWQVNTIDEFEKLYKQEFTGNRRPDRMFRGLQEAKYKLYNSAQRYWILNQLSDWDKSKPSYIDMISKMVDIARNDELLKNAFNYYNLPFNQWDFPILSILQHYGAPTPLMDWTHDPNVALFFATEGVQSNNCELDDINNYFSIYYITKKEQNKDTKASGDQLKNILDWNNGSYPTIDKFTGYEDSVNFLLYLSGYEKEDKTLAHYNLNIIAQRGVFIFTPLRNMPIEELFANEDEDRDFRLIKFRCYNIHKRLAEYIRVKLKKEKEITHNRLFPNLKINAEKIKSDFLAELL